jgi:hypothetical protein
MLPLRRFICALGLLLAGLSAQAQNKGIPNEVYYLMPGFGQGYIYFRGQAPAQGQLNICAVDNTLRFIDKSGQEMVASNADNVVKVLIDTVVFLNHQGVYYRLSSVGPDMGLALRRDVKILSDVKQAGYGTTSQTSSIKSYNTIYSDGAVYNLEEGKTYPYEVTETLFLFKGDTVFPLTKKNLRKLFPGKKEQVDAYFSAGGTVPETLPEARVLLQSLAD